VKKTTKARQWLMDSGEIQVAVNSTFFIPIVGDPQNNWTFDGRVLRMLLSVNLNGDAEFNAGVGSFAYGGLIHKPTSMTNNFQLTTNNDADAGWLYRHRWRVPFVRNPSGPFDLNGEAYHLDWAIHGGNGTNLRRDSTFGLSFGWGPGFGNLIVGWSYWLLVDST